MKPKVDRVNSCPQVLNLHHVIIIVDIRNTTFITVTQSALCCHKPAQAVLLRKPNQTVTEGHVRMMLPFTA